MRALRLLVIGGGGSLRSPSPVATVCKSAQISTQSSFAAVVRRPALRSLGDDKRQRKLDCCFLLLLLAMRFAVSPSVGIRLARVQKILVWAEVEFHDAKRRHAHDRLRNVTNERVRQRLECASKKALCFDFVPSEFCAKCAVDREVCDVGASFFVRALDVPLPNDNCRHWVPDWACCAYSLDLFRHGCTLTPYRPLCPLCNHACHFQICNHE